MEIFKYKYLKVVLMYSTSTWVDTVSFFPPMVSTNQTLKSFYRGTDTAIFTD